MDAKTLLERLCARHGVHPDQGERLLPLVRWALMGPEDSRERILAAVERSLADDGSGALECQDELDSVADQAVLVAVARVLHDWSPADRVLGVDFDATGALGEAGSEPEA